MKRRELFKSLYAVVVPLFFLLKRVNNLVYVLTFCFLFSGGLVCAQSNKVTINMVDVTMDQVFDRLEQLTDYSFLFQGNAIDSQKKVTIHQKNSSINQVLDVLFKGMPVQYEISNKQIVLSPKQNSNSPQAPKGQKRSVSGVVTDPNGQPIPGATVVDKNNMSVGTVPDLDGNYSLLLDGDNPVLVVSFIGMKPKQIDADFSKVMKVRLEGESLGLEEVVSQLWALSARPNH